MRPLSENERALITCIAEKLNSAEREQLLADMACASVKEVSADGAIIMFDIRDYRHAPGGQHSYGVEGYMLDSDNAKLSVILYADKNGRLLELEFIRWDSDDAPNPQWETLKLF